MGPKRPKNERRIGPNFVEVGIAMLISVLAVVAASPLPQSAVIKSCGRTNLVKRYHLPVRRFPRRHQLSRLSSLISIVRGGSQEPSTPPGFAAPPPYQPEQNQQQQQQREFQQQLQQEFQQPLQQSEYPPDQLPPNIGHANEDVPFQETLQDRIDTWRTYQMEHAKEQRASLSPRDEKGRMKLLTSVSKGSRAITFFFLMWRNVHLYEVVDQKFKGTLRYVCVVPLTFLFIANMAGVVASITSSSGSSKKRLKAILNLDKLMELFLILHNIGKLIFSSSNLVPKELYVSHILHSFFFLLQCQTVTRFVWDEGIPVATGAPPAGVEPNQEFDDSQWMQQQRMSPGDNNDDQSGPHIY